jgi:hypothetical protein
MLVYLQAAFWFTTKHILRKNDNTILRLQNLFSPLQAVQHNTVHTDIFLECIMICVLHQPRPGKPLKFAAISGNTGMAAGPGTLAIMSCRTYAGLGVTLLQPLPPLQGIGWPGWNSWMSTCCWMWRVSLRRDSKRRGICRLVGWPNWGSASAMAAKTARARITCQIQSIILSIRTCSVECVCLLCTA